MVSLPSSKDSKPATGLGDPSYVDKARRFNQKMCPRKLWSHELNGWGVRESVFRLFRLIWNVYDIHMYIHILCPIKIVKYHPHLLFWTPIRLCEDHWTCDAPKIHCSVTFFPGQHPHSLGFSAVFRHTRASVVKTSISTSPLRFPTRRCTRIRGACCTPRMEPVQKTAISRRLAT